MSSQAGRTHTVPTHENMYDVYELVRKVLGNADRYKKEFPGEGGPTDDEKFAAWASTKTGFPVSRANIAKARKKFGIQWHNVLPRPKRDVIPPVPQLGEADCATLYRLHVTLAKRFVRLERRLEDTRHALVALANELGSVLPGDWTA